MQPPKSSKQIDAMRVGGKILAGILKDLREKTVPGVNELELDEWVEQEIIKRGAVVTYKTPEVNFPASICISVNSGIVHGIPRDNVLQKGDVVKFDLDITYDDMVVDSAFTMVVGEEPTGAKKHLLDTTERAMWAGIDVAGPVHVGDISAAVEKVLNDGKLGIVRELVGHGVGNSYHMAPEVPNYGRAGTGGLLAVGDTICIEPMAMLGNEAVKLGDDGWLYETKDGSLAAHFEHTVLITENGCEILTLA